MSKLMMVFGALFLALGVALGVLWFASSGQMQVLALTPDIAALFLVGGALCLGFANVISLLHNVPGLVPGLRVQDEQHKALAAIVSTRKQFAQSEDQDSLANQQKASPRYGASVRPAARAAELATVAAIASQADHEPVPHIGQTSSVAETISALEQAKSDIAAALGIEAPAHPAEGIKTVSVVEKEELLTSDHHVNTLTQLSVTETVTEPSDQLDEPELFVVEEKVIRGRPARVLSDGTVEAETDEGWMRFENLDHLDEYLEAMAPEA